MKILHIGFSDKLGGASIGMMRLHKSLLDSKVDSLVLVAEKLTKLSSVIGPTTSYEKLANDIKIILARQKKYFYNHDGKYSHSINLFNSNLIKKINKIKPDIINLHWINNELISIKDISKIKLPIVWTFHDMWPMCGGEHYSESDRFKFGYDQTNKEKNETGIDLNRFLWNRKKKYWNSKINHIVCSSKWLKSKTLESLLFKNHNISLIPPALDLNEWFPVEKTQARNILKLPQDKKILLFMSTNGDKDLRKGYKFIKSLLNGLLNKNENVVILNIGQNSELNLSNKVININQSFSGDATALKIIYSSADILLAPSLMEAFGQVAIEAASCGTPTIAFKKTGLEDTIEHKKTGYLSEYMDQHDFEEGIRWALNEQTKDQNFFSDNCIKFVTDNFSSQLIAKKYIDIYKTTLKSNKSKNHVFN